MALLAGFNSSQPMAFISSSGPRGLALTRERWARCGKYCDYRFPWAQPAILSRGALEKFREPISANFMTEAQKVWYGTHDIHLGLAFWWLSIPVLSLEPLEMSKSREGLHVHNVRGETGKLAVSKS